MKNLLIAMLGEDKRRSMVTKQTDTGSRGLLAEIYRCNTFSELP